MSDIMYRSEAAIRVEELKSNLKRKSSAVISTGQGQKNVQSQREPKRQRSEPQGEERRNGNVPRIKGQERPYTALNVPASKVWLENKQLFRSPFPLGGDPNQRDRSRRCPFHNDYGHTIDECKSMRNQIEAMLRKGMLQKYVKGRNNKQGPEDKDKRPDQEESPPQRVINMIGGGPGLGDNDYSRRGAYRRAMKVKRMSEHAQPKEVLHTKRGVDDITSMLEEIAFSRSDLEGLHLPHTDPLVVELSIANCKVRRVLIDGGSEADVLFYSTFKEMGLDQSMMKHTRVPLVSFDDQEVRPMGAVTLQVTAVGRTLDMEFMVVNASSAYNCIMGRIWIHAMEGVPSTYHQVMRCWTDDGPRDIRGCQVMAKKCFNMDRKKAKGKDKVEEKLKAKVEVKEEIPQEPEVRCSKGIHING